MPALKPDPEAYETLKAGLGRVGQESRKEGLDGSVKASLASFGRALQQPIDPFNDMCVAPGSPRACMDG